MSQELLEVCGLVLALVALTALFQRALAPLLRRLLRTRFAATAFAAAGPGGARAAHGGVAVQRDAPARLGSPA